MSDAAIKFDQSKPRYSLVPAEIPLALAEVFTHGAEKYGEGNWAKGLAYSRLYDAALRHLFAFWAGENTDPESGRTHLAHALWNVSILLVQTQRRTGLNDRNIA